MKDKMKLVDGTMYEYTLYDRVDQYAEVLRQNLESFDFSNPPTDARKLAISLIETMAYYKGIGMSANQVGLPYRVFVMGSEGVGYACFNPEILESEGEEEYQEGCISYPGLVLKVKRAKSIKVRFTDMYGITKEQRFDGLTARVFQHELDHLNGVLFTSKVSKTALERARDKIKKNLKEIERAEYRAHVIKNIMEQKKKIEKTSAELQNQAAEMKNVKVQDLTKNIIAEADKLQSVASKKPTVFEYNTGS